MEQSEEVHAYVHMCVCARRWLGEYVLSGTCMVLICMNTKVSVSDIIVLHYVNSSILSIRVCAHRWLSAYVGHVLYF